MGNTTSNKRDRTCSADSEYPSSPTKDDKIFNFSSESRNGRFLYQPSLEECDDILSTIKDKTGDVTARSETLSSSSSATIQFPTVFKWDGGGKEVYISGTFSDWKPIPMVESHGDFALILDVPEGEHEYKFQVDGKWVHSSNQPNIDNDMGTKNNFLSVKKSDFEVFEALAVDSKSSSKIHGCAVNDSPNETFVQSIPTQRNRNAVPPVLPPHLLEVILNKDVSSNNEPILLPEPNHVMLNHLYALSIKEGIVVLSATFRYKKKYVTTLLYKPI